MRQSTARRWRSSLRQPIRRGLVEPFLSRRHPPEYVARGVFVGLFVALTPTVGLQIPLLALAWGFTRKFAPRRVFSSIAATAWSFVSNPLTVAPLYYVFVVTGRVILGRWNRMRGYEVFEERLTSALPADPGWLDATWAQIAVVFDRFGLPMVVGCLPWALLFSTLGYRWSLRLIERRRARRERRRARARSKADRPSA